MQIKFSLELCYTCLINSQQNVKNGGLHTTRFSGESQNGKNIYFFWKLLVFAFDAREFNPEPNIKMLHHSFHNSKQ